MNAHAVRPRPHARRFLRPLAYVLALVLPPVLVAAGMLAGLASAGAAPPAVVRSQPTPPDHDPDRRTAVIVAGNAGAESIDLLAPYELLAVTEAFNVYTVAPERRPLPLFPGAPGLAGVDLLPHFSLEEFDRLFDTDPDVVVVPFIPSASTPEDAAVLAWLRARVGHETTLLTICGGAWQAADAGLLDGHRATTHQNVFAAVEVEHPDVRWIRGQRWVDDGNVTSSAGITAGIDATLHVVDELLGRGAARAAARAIGYPHLQFLDDPRYTVPAADMTTPLLAAAYGGPKTDVGLVLHDGVGEIAVASVADIIPRSFTTRIHTVAPARALIQSRHGLHLVPRHDFSSAPALDRIVVPGRDPGDTVAAATDAWARERGLTAEYPHRDAAAVFPFDAVLRDMAARDTRALASATATGIEYPLPEDALPGGAWPFALLVPPSLLGVLGVLLTAAWFRRRPTRPSAVGA